MTVLSVQHLRKAFSGNQVVNDVSFGVAAGEIVALIGPNGAGKSTCFNMLTGQLRPDSGRIQLLNDDIQGLSPDRIWRLGVGRGFQIAATFGSMTVRDNVRTALISYHRSVWRFFRPAADLYSQEADALLDQVGILHLASKGACFLAYGDLKRLELALAMSNQPRLLLVDEPTSGMMPVDRQGIMDLLVATARRSGCAVLFTEHDMESVFRTADRVMVMDKGVLIAIGDATAIKADPKVRLAYLGTEPTMIDV